ncbi:MULTISPECIES: hypothetical protein [Bacillus]|uniref:DksA C4-type domain-containing protein n=1 Tax=Bacillus velezensis TaxID=492670 RepID=A0ABC8D9X3_BACVE|nr:MULTISPECIES: hypothetical protein [Bacillus]ANB49361.1 hypothetical protein A1D33_018905 [Bacillus velezensis]AVI28912.1 hypothetical protein C3Z10_11220 [Bacillus velezensis]AWX72565.1 hypothetical protein BVDSYZ_11240 [Bacillus velezensis]MBR7816855.1 hypothetical protein [Bacillus sp. CCNWLCWHY013]MDK2560076.1 hypothetical protein [Bacillus amyloliquefaciens]
MSGKLTKDQLEVIRKRSEEATEGPWRIGKQSPNGLNNIGTIGGLLTAQTTDEEDANFIANARQDIPSLLDHITFLNEVISNCRCAECGDELGEDWATNSGVAFCNYCAGLNSL